MYNCETLKVRVMLFYDTGFQNYFNPAQPRTRWAWYRGKRSLREGGNLLSLDGTESRAQVIRVTGPWDSVLVPSPQNRHFDCEYQRPRFYFKM